MPMMLIQIASWQTVSREGYTLPMANAGPKRLGGRLKLNWPAGETSSPTLVNANEQLLRDCWDSI